MSQLVQFLTSKIFLAAVAAWLSSVILKWIIYAARKEERTLHEAFANGGMPSSHSALVASLSAAIFFFEGLSTSFYISLMVAVIVMSDAFRVRRNLGMQGDSINKLLLKLKQNPIVVVHGHSFFQVCCGALWGIFVAFLVFQYV